MLRRRDILYWALRHMFDFYLAMIYDPGLCVALVGLIDLFFLSGIILMKILCISGVFK